MDNEDEAKAQEHKRMLSALAELGGTRQVLSSLRTSAQTGLTTLGEYNDQSNRRRRYGENKKKVTPPRSIMSMITEQFEDTILRILLAAATVSLAIGIWREGIQKGWYEGVTIYIALVIIVTVTATNDYMKEKQFRRLLAVRKER